MKAVERAGRGWTRESGGVMLSEWEKDGWTYHAKGTRFPSVCLCMSFV